MVNLTTLNCRRIRYTLLVIRSGARLSLLHPHYSRKVAVKYLQKFSVERSVKRNVIDGRVEFMDRWING